MRRFKLLIALLVGLSLIAAACGGDDTDDTAPATDETSADETEAADEAEGGEEADTGGESDDAAAGGAAPSGDPIVLGMPINQSGPIGVADHQDWVNGVTLAIEEINAAGGVLGRPLETFVVDTDILTPEGTSAGFLAMGEAEVDAILSPFVLIPQPALDAAAYGAPYLHGNTQQATIDAYLTDPERYNNMFQIDAPETFYGSGFIPFLDELAAGGNWTPKNNKIHIVQAEIAYTQTISQATQQAIDASGGTWELGGITDIQSPVTDWAPIIADLKESDSGIIMIDHWVAAELASFTQAFAADPIEDTLVYLQYGPSQPEFLDLGGDATEGFVWGTVTGVYADEQGQAFRDAYMARFPGTMGLVYTGAGYDTVHLLAEAIEAAGSTEFAPVIEALEQTAYRGVNGFYSFTEERTVPVFPEQVDDPEAGQAHLFFQVQEGAHRIISPNPYTEVEFVSPPWAG